MSNSGSNVAPAREKEAETKTVLLRDCMTHQKGFAFKSKDYTKEGRGVARVSDFTSNSIDITTCNFLPEFKGLDHNNVTLRQGDIIIATVGSWPTNPASVVGKTICVPKKANGFLLNQNAVRLRASSNVDQRYLYYSLKNYHFSNHLINRAQGSASQASISLKDIFSYQFKLPPLAEQKRIAHILGTLDDKIELNRRMNETLEAMAQALFKSWFIDFDPVIDNAILAGNPIPEELSAKAETRRKILQENKDNAPPTTHHALFPNSFTETEELGWVPEGWEVSTLGNFLEIKRGGSPRPIKDYIQPTGLPWVKIADATASPSRFLFTTKERIKPEGLKKTVLLNKGSLILSNSATPGLPIFLELNACIHDGWLHFPKKEYFGDQYLYQLFLVIREELINKGNGSVFTNLKTDILRAQPLTVPPLTILGIFEKWAKINFNKIKSVNKENQTLAKLRDTLLQKLTSGEHLNE